MFSRFAICDLPVFSMPRMSVSHASDVLVYAAIVSHGSHVRLAGSLVRMLYTLLIT